MEARFDDLTPGGRCFQLQAPVGVVEARRPAEVVGCLRAAWGATRRGLWVAGFLAYEAAPGLDRHLAVRAREPADPFADLPLAWFAMFGEARAAPLPEPARPPLGGGPTWRPSVPRERHADDVRRIRAHIAAGDVYQVNHTLRLRARLQGDPRALYRDLCLAQRGAYNAYLDLGRYVVLSASPELFFLLEGDHVATRPMKGTRARGRWAEEDRARAGELAASVKDRAENAMIVDLLRNDLGRICRPGTVEVPSLFDVERYETVWQMTSTVTGRLRPGVGLIELLRALFPSGSVTGAPKVRAMQLIAALETTPRGVYTGAVGYLAPAGARPTARFNVAIRTVVVDRASGTAEYGTGGGITYGSSPEAEHREALDKAAVLTVRRPPFRLLETLRHEPGRGVLFLPEHLERLGASADYFGFPWDEAAVRAALEEAIGAAEAGGRGPLRVRLTLGRSGDVEAHARPLPPDPPGPVRVVVDDEPVDPTDPLLFHKTTYRARYRQAAARHPGADDVLLVNPEGQVTEATVANVAVRLEGRWWTPPLSSGCLPGVYRRVLLEGGRLAERPIAVADLARAEEMALVNSVRLWRRAVLATAEPASRRAGPSGGRTVRPAPPGAPREG